jgi:hypothetical protein
VTRYLILHREKREQEWDTSYEREEEQLDDLRRDHEQEGGEGGAVTRRGNLTILSCRSHMSGAKEKKALLPIIGISVS